MVQEVLRKIYFYLLIWDRLVIPPFWLILIALGIAAALHALMNKRDPRAALSWTVVCLAIPGLGPLAYLILGVNRIRSRAQDWHEKGKFKKSDVLQGDSPFNWQQFNPGYSTETYQNLVTVSDSITPLPLVRNCTVEPLFNGEQAYPKMLAAIDSAKKWIFLETYIFEPNRTGEKFMDALLAAIKRGVEVRILLDGVGTLNPKPKIHKVMKKRGIPHVMFLPISFSPRSVHLNLRTHRKIMVVDGKVGFTGGMNIGDRHLVTDPENKNITQDIHFQLKGPILAQLQEAFLQDWYFAQEKPRPEERYPCEKQSEGTALCRGINAGPNEAVDQLRWLINAAITCAREQIRIMTPYFIPDQEMTSALLTAAMRGVDIQIILPKKNNIPYVNWASQALMEDLLQFGVQVYFQPPPFAHSKLLLIDDFYSLIGSANLDPRSLVLNFEFNVEVFDQALNNQLIRHYVEVLQHSEEITLHDLESRPFRIKLRDSVAKLFSPYI